MKLGDIIFFKKYRNTNTKGFTELTFKGMGFGILLGHCHPKDRTDPSEDEVWRLIGESGLIGFDHIEEFLGKKAMDTCIKKFEKKFQDKEG